MITGFQATMEIDDGGNGGTGASTEFSGLVTFGLPSVEALKFDGTELNQKDGGAVDPYERELPTGTLKVAPTKAEMKYTKANYTRLQALIGDRGKTIKLITPDDLTNADAPTKLTVAFKGWVSIIGEVQFEKGKPVSIPFEITQQGKPTYS